MLCQRWSRGGIAPPALIATRPCSLRALAVLRLVSHRSAQSWRASMATCAGIAPTSVIPARGFLALLRLTAARLAMLGMAMHGPVGVAWRYRTASVLNYATCSFRDLALPLIAPYGPARHSPAMHSLAHTVQCAGIAPARFRNH